MSKSLRSVFTGGLVLLMTTGAYAQGFAQRPPQPQAAPAIHSQAPYGGRTVSGPGYGDYYGRERRRFPARKLAAIGGGAAVGGLIGGATGKGAKGVAVGAVAGAIAGLVLESALDRHHRRDW